jgi:hypothetical protein
VFGANSEFTMSGGEISGNTAGNAGGVGVWQYTNGTFNMSGGVIKNNTASADGGGVYVLWSGTFNMTGGEIAVNTANRGGGLYKTPEVTFTGDPQIGGVIHHPWNNDGWIHSNTPQDLFTAPLPGYGG